MDRSCKTLQKLLKATAIAMVDIASKESKRTRKGSEDPTSVAKLTRIDLGNGPRPICGNEARDDCGVPNATRSAEIASHTTNSSVAISTTVLKRDSRLRLASQQAIILDLFREDIKCITGGTD